MPSSQSWIPSPAISYLLNPETSMTMWADDPKWSYVELSDAELATRVVEKEVVSDCATVGIYNFAQGKDFVSAAERMIAQDLRVNGEFYVAPVYNLMDTASSAASRHRLGVVSSFPTDPSAPRCPASHWPEAASARRPPSQAPSTCERSKHPGGHTSP